MFEIFVMISNRRHQQLHPGNHFNKHVGLTSYPGWHSKGFYLRSCLNGPFNDKISDWKQ